jgi:hypothetical protein
MSPSSGSQVRNSSLARRVALVIVAQSDYRHWEQLTQLPGAVTELRKALEGSRYELHLPELVGGGSKGEIEVALDAWLRGLSATDRLVLYWIGHGTGNGGHYLVTRESPKHDLTGAVALKADLLGEMVGKSQAEKVLVILDTCYSSAGAEGIAGEVQKLLNIQPALAGQRRCVAVVPSASALTKAQEGACCRALRRLLTDPEAPNRSWGDGDEWIKVGDLSDALLAMLAEEFGAAWQPPTPTVAGWGHDFLPNPRFHGPQPVIDVETRRRLLQVPQALALAARGIEVGEGGWYFTGRIQILRELVDWLRSSSAGLLVLTGPPGSGKSAVIGRLVTLSDPGFRAEATAAGALSDTPEETIPSEGMVDSAVHVKGRTEAEFARSAAEELALDLPTYGPFSRPAFVAAVGALGRRLTLVVDALDEAADPYGIGNLLGDVAEQTGVRVLVGCRRSPDGRTLSTGEDRHARLRALFGESVTILDLEDEVDTREDIASYVTLRLQDSPHRDNPKAIDQVARAVAEKADGVFLYARVVARTLQDAERLDGPLPGSALEAFASDIEARFGDRKGLVDELLSALAWGEGAGLSRRVWAAVATALSPTGAAYEDRDVAWVLDHAGWHILEAGEAGQTAYRLAHQAFADAYRARVANVSVAQRAITRELAGWRQR